MKQSIVLQSVDSPRRDMEWRLFVASKLAERGISSVIGSKAAIRGIHARSTNCIILGRLNSNTGRTRADNNYVKEMETKKTALFFIHDEGGLYFKGEYAEWVRRIYPEEYFSSEALKKVLFWGEAQKNVFEDSPERHKFQVAGFPRFDLCKPEFESIDSTAVNDLKKKYGNFILICGRFAAVNMVADDPPSLGRRSYDMRVESGSLKTQKKEEILRSMFGAWEKTSLEFSQFVHAVARLALDFPKLNIVLRPHPAEKESFYKEAFSHFQNVFIDKSGDVRPFIRASFTVLHSECTTGLEAELSRKPNINFRPCMNLPLSRDFEVAGASDIGIIVEDYGELHKAVSALIDNNYIFQKSRYDASKLILNLREDISSTDLICNIIEEYAKGKKNPSQIVSGFGSLNYLKYISFVALKSFVKKGLGKIGVERFKKLAVGEGDLKFYEFKDHQIRTLWACFGSKNIKISNKNGIIFVIPKKP
jgi:surface carbohydrate biosynthesis protein